MSEQHWFKRIGNGNNFCNSSDKKILFLSSKNANDIHFMKNAKKGDKLWFMLGNSKGRIIGVATFIEFKERVIGPLISLTKTNEELGWDNDTGSRCTHELYYDELYNIFDANVSVKLNNRSSMLKFESSKYPDINLPIEYHYITKYSKPVDRILITEIKNEST